MNVWDLINREAQSPDIDAGLLEETRRLMRLVALSERHSELARATSSLVAKEATWEDVSTALCGTIHGAMIALATQQADPERFLSDYLRPHQDDQPWTFPPLQEGPPQVRERTDIQFVIPSPPPAAAEPTSGLQAQANAAHLAAGIVFIASEPEEDVPAEAVTFRTDVPATFQNAAMADFIPGAPVLLDRFTGPYPSLAPPEYRSSLAHDAVLPLQELAPGMYISRINPEKANRDSA